MSAATRNTHAARTLLSFLLWTALSAGLVGFIQLGTQPPSVNSSPAASSSCTPSGLRFYNGTDDRPVTTAEQRGTLTLASNSTLYQQVCQPGTVRMLVRGTPAEGIDARLVITLGSRNLLITAAANPRPLELRIEAPGLLAVTFDNDLYLPDRTSPEDRNVFIQGLMFTPDP